jgi:hypothetical protein
MWTRPEGDQIFGGPGFRGVAVTKYDAVLRVGRGKSAGVTRKAG